MVRPLLVVAAELSADRAAARVVDHLRPEGFCPFGLAGPRLLESGTVPVAELGELTGIGLDDALRRAGKWLRTWVALRQSLAEQPPAVALLVDAPELNLPLARILRDQGVPVVLYVGPQVWAWRPGRLGLLSRRTDVVALTLPFEQKLYDRAGVHARYVGHPLLDEPEPAAAAREVVRQRLGFGDQEQLVALLPGSRPGEVALLAQPMLDAGARLGSDRVRPVFAPAPGAAPPGLLNRVESSGVQLLPSDLGARDLLAAADAALLASGTVTLEAAMSRVPMAVVYRLGPLSWPLARLLVDVPYISLPNWVAGRKIVPELIQHQVTGPALADQVRRLLEPDEARRQREELAQVEARLGTPGASKRVAQLCLDAARH